MTLQERLAEIESKVKKERIVCSQLIQPEKSWIETMEEREWLIARVKALEARNARLTEALEEIYKYKNRSGVPGPESNVARKALEDE